MELHSASELLEYPSGYCSEAQLQLRAGTVHMVPLTAGCQATLLPRWGGDAAEERDIFQSEQL